MTGPTRRAVLALPLAACAGPTSAPLASLAIEEAYEACALAKVGLGGTPLLALIDNGAPVSRLDQEFARRAGLLPSGGALIGPTAVEMGGTRVQTVFDPADLSELAIGTDRPVAAILGMDLFRAHAVGVSSGTLRLYDRLGFSPPADTRAQRLYPALRGEREVRVVVDEEEAFEAILDLGCSTPLLVSAALAQRLGIGERRLASTRQAMIAADGGLAARTSVLSSVGSLAFAGRTFRDAPVNVMPREAGPFAGYDAVIG